MSLFSIQELVLRNHREVLKRQQMAQSFATASLRHSISGQPSDVYASRLAVPYELHCELSAQFDLHDDTHWLTSSTAASYCMDRTGRTDIDWHSVLLENRRDQMDITAIMEDKAPRGNVALLGELHCFKLGRKVYYRVTDLDYWLANLPKSMQPH